MDWARSLFSAIVDALRGNSTSIEDLLQRQLEAIAQIVQDALLNADLANCQELIRAYVIRYKEYTNQKNPTILEYVLNESNTALSRLYDHGFAGYQSYMVCASLLMTALQEVVRLGNDGARKDVTDQHAAAVAFHSKVEEQINLSTSVPYLAQRFRVTRGYYSCGKISEKGGARWMPVERGHILGKQLPGRACVFFWTNRSTELTAQEADELVKTQ